MRIVLLGAPGSGKGTQAQRLAQKRGMPQISTGDLLRAAVTAGSALGTQAKAAMDAGRLVADEIVLGIIAERLSSADVGSGFVLDGFPRNIEQATALDAMLAKLGQPLDAVVLMEVDRAELVRRIAGRWTCRDCGRVFNLATPAASGSGAMMRPARNRTVHIGSSSARTTTNRRLPNGSKCTKRRPSPWWSSTVGEGYCGRSRPRALFMRSRPDWTPRSG